MNLLLRVLRLLRGKKLNFCFYAMKTRRRMMKVSVLLKFMFILSLLVLTLVPVRRIQAEIRARYDYPPTAMSHYTVNLIQSRLIHLAGAKFPGDITIRLFTDPEIKSEVGEEGYRVTIEPEEITIQAASENGLLYGAVSLIEWVIARTTPGIDDRFQTDIDFPVRSGQAREFLQHLPNDQYQDKPFYPIRFFHLSNYAMGVSDLIDSEMNLEKHNFFSGVETGFADALPTWKAWCDWCSRHRINYLSNWPYSAGTNWWDLAVDKATQGMSKYPDEEIESAAALRENLFEYAQSRGLKPFLMNYLTGSATATIARNRPDLIGELDPDDKDHTGSLSFCYADNKLNDVFCAQIKAILRTYPSLAGLHIRWWGESYPCQCDNCRGRQGELQRELTLKIIEAANEERPDIEILLSGRLFLHGTQAFWNSLPDNVILQTKWGRDWEPTADPNLPFDKIAATGHPFLVSEALPGEEVSPFGSVQYLPYRDGVLKYAGAADQMTNLSGFSVVVADKDFGWITETNFLAAARLNWAPFQVNLEDFIGNYLGLTYGDAAEDVSKALELTQQAWQEYCVDFDGIALYKDYNHLAWMHGLDSVRTTDVQKLQRNLQRITRHAQMMTQALYILDRAREKAKPQGLVAFDDLTVQTDIFAEFFTSRQLLAEAFLHRHEGKKTRMRDKLKMVVESNRRLIRLALSKPNLASYFEMEGMSEATNYMEGYIYLTMEAAWSFLQNRVFEEIEELQKMISESE